MATVKELVVSLGFDVKDSDLKKFEKSIQSAKSSMFALGATVAAAGAALFGIAKSTANHGEEASKLSKKLGLTTDTYQGLAAAAKMADVSTEEFNTGLSFLNRTIGQARLGSKQAMQGFNLLGGGVANMVAKGSSTEDILFAISSRLEQVKDPAKKAALAMEFFGRSGAGVAGFLSKGPDALREQIEAARMYGQILDKDVIEASNEFNDNIKESFALLSGFKNIIGGELVKAIAPFLKQINQWIKANHKLIVKQLSSFLEGLVDILKVAFSVITKLVNILTPVINAFGGLGTVLKVVIGLFAAFKAMQLLIAIGEIAMGVGKLIKGLRLASLSMALMNAQALLIPLLIGAAIAFLILIIEDVIGYFNGKDSVTAVVIDAFKNLSSGAQAALTMLLGPIGFVINAIRLIATAIDYVTSKFEFLSGIRAKIAPVIDFLKFGQSVTGGGPNFVSPQGALPGSGVASQKTLNNSITAPITVNVGDSTDPMVAEKIGSSVYDGLDALMRDSSRSLSTSVAY